MAQCWEMLLWSKASHGNVPSKGYFMITKMVLNGCPVAQLLTWKDMTFMTY